MPTTVTSSKGTVYHLWQLHAESAREVSPSVEFNEVRNDLGDGYRAQVMYGSDTGIRSWSLTLPSLAGSGVSVPTVTSITGATVSREQYLWDLYKDTRTTGKPFVFICPHDNQYYLTDFTDKRLRYDKTFRQKLYSTGIELGQVREKGETIFNVAQMSSYVAGEAGNEWYTEASHSISAWRQVFYAGLSSAPQFDTTNCTLAANPQNGHNTVRFTAGSSSEMTHNKLGSPNNLTVYDLILVMKVREATFTGNAGIVNNAGATDYLRGASGTALFSNLGLFNFEYRLNGALYDQTAMAAPMNVWGVVHLRFIGLAGQTMSALTIGQSIASVYSNIDIGEIRITPSLTPMSDIRAYTESLVTKWAAGT